MGKIKALILLAVIVATLVPQMVKLGHCAVDMSIIATIESNNNPKAYNKSSGTVGMYQITPIVVKDFNKWLGASFTIDDMYNSSAAKIVASWYLEVEIPRLLRYFHKETTTDNILWCYNAGIGNLVKGRKPAETRNYIKKYHKIERGTK